MQRAASHAAISENLRRSLCYLSQQFHNPPPPPPPQKKKKKKTTELLKLLQRVHSLVITCGLSHHSSFLTQLLLHCLSLSSFPSAYASSLFTQIRRPNISIYNALIRGFAFNFHSQSAAFFYSKMRRDGLLPDKHTFPLLLKSKIYNPFEIFGHVIKFGFVSDNFVSNSLVAAFASVGHPDCGRQVFDEMRQKDVVAYTALMDGYVKNAHPLHALELFLEMRVMGVEMDGVTVVSALCAIGMLRCLWLGRWIHGFYVESGRVLLDVYVGTALVDMYSKCGCCEDALSVFRGMPHRNVISWSALLAGYSQCSEYNETLLLFLEMLVEKIEPNEVVLTSVLTACAQLGALDQGRWLHKYILASKLELNSVLETALIDMYAKCGCLEAAFSVFEKMAVKDVYPWTALIFGLAINGDAPGSLNLFRQMISSGVQPNEVTFIAILSACSHGGCVSEGLRLFSLMERDYGIRPTVDHYGCMVDLLGRAGYLGEAVKLIDDMPMEPSAGIWGALFGACMIHKEFELGKSVGNQLIKLQPYHSGRYALLANLYSKSCDWEGAAVMKRKLNEVRVRRSPGCSWIASDGAVHVFVAFDNSDAASASVYEALDSLTAQIEQFPSVFEDGLLVL